MSEQNGEDCKPCRVGVLLGLTNLICKKSDPEECDKLYEEARSGKITVQEFVNRISPNVTDEVDRKTLERIVVVAGEFKAAGAPTDAVA